MYQEEIKKICKTITKASPLMNKEMAKELGITPVRFSAIVNQGDMKLSTFLKLVEVCGYQIELSPSSGDGLVAISPKNKCNECAYKKVADSLDDSITVKLNEETGKVVLEG